MFTPSYSPTPTAGNFRLPAAFGFFRDLHPSTPDPWSKSDRDEDSGLSFQDIANAIVKRVGFI